MPNRGFDSCSQYLQHFLDIDCVVPAAGSVACARFQRPVDAAHGEADHVEDVEQGQEAEIGTTIHVPLQAHQLLHRC